MLSMHIGINKPERGCIRQLFHTVVSGQWSVVPCSLLCPVHRQISSYVLKNVNTYPPPPNPYTAFSHRFQRAYTYPPHTRNEVLAHRTKSQKTPGKTPKPTELAHCECLQEKLGINGRY